VRLRPLERGAAVAPHGLGAGRRRRGRALRAAHSPRRAAHRPRRRPPARLPGGTGAVPLVEPVAWPGWRHLPRDTRDTLFLLGVIAWTVLPHLPHLPAWCLLLTAAVLLWRGRLALANAALPGRW